MIEVAGKSSRGKASNVKMHQATIPDASNDILKKRTKE
jgi:hypothetical protein